MHASRDTRPPAVLLLGPTGAGKTPLGEHLETHGLAGRRCVHFDFGACLRAADSGTFDAGLTAAERDVVAAVLRGGALLENEHFGLAAKLFHAFCRRRAVTAETWIVMNGLPRHAGQARDVDTLVQMRAVVVLACTAEVVRGRIARDTGGDRAGRVDDGTDAITRKLALFEARTAPLAQAYGRKGVSLIRIPVTVNMIAGEMAARLGVVDPATNR